MPIVDIDFGQEKIERWSRQHLSDGRNIAAVLDGRVLSIAPLKEGAILRESPLRPLAGARRKAVTRLFARLAAQRLAFSGS